MQATLAMADAAIAACLLDAKANVNQPAKSGDTPLARSIVMGHPQLALQLISAGADVNQANKVRASCVRV